MAGFNADGSRRIAKAIRRVEQTPRTRIKNPSGPRSPWFAATFKVTEAIEPSNGGDTPGKGKGTMQAFDEATEKYKDLPDEEFDIYTDDMNGIIVGAYVQCVVKYGRWFYDVTPCQNGAS